ncbi:hypothetical protein Cch01nite_19870 [Cellulomonas chitinilytica]|uniref:Uncharacterized protein n=1 Tax=Cellulomonas chitinilytica TaxID=398759 RepID=A0A919TZV9_9CELL|nr:hypothetical protein [Cellulomonas chitinilytica]GIG21263.1 hypothetical protein Cch01nite_19870 [Cellulomonas chitinilytica]
MRYTFTIAGSVEVDDVGALAATIGPVRGVSPGDESVVDIELEPNVAILALLVRAVSDGLDRPGLGRLQFKVSDVQPS